MPIRFHCENCGKRVRVPDGSQGRRVKCPACGTAQAVPRSSSAATASATGAAPNQPAEQAPSDDALSSLASAIDEAQERHASATARQPGADQAETQREELPVATPRGKRSFPQPKLDSGADQDAAPGDPDATPDSGSGTHAASRSRARPQPLPEPSTDAATGDNTGSSTTYDADVSSGSSSGAAALSPGSRRTRPGSGTRVIPLSSRAGSGMAHRSRAVPKVLEDQPGSVVRPDTRGAEPPPHLSLLLTLGWLLRGLAALSVAGMVKIMLWVGDMPATTAVDQLIAALYGLALTALLWGAAEAILTVRQIARRTGVGD